MIESIEKLRKAASGRFDGATGYVDKNAKKLFGVKESTGLDSVLFETIADEIEREIAEKYMELPVDADGVPIHVGDTLQLGDTRGEVVALTYCPSNGKLPWEWQCDTGDWYNTAFARHANPDQVKELLEEFLEAGGCVPHDWSNVIGEYAARIREAVSA